MFLQMHSFLLSSCLPYRHSTDSDQESQAAADKHAQCYISLRSLCLSVLSADTSLPVTHLKTVRMGPRKFCVTPG